MPKKKTKKTHIWNGDYIDGLMEQYQLAHKQKRWGECDRLYALIRPEHQKLLKARLNIKKIPTTTEVLNDMLSHLHDVMVKYWKPNTGKSSMSYFIMAIETTAAQYWTGGLPSSVEIRKSPAKWAQLETHPIENKRKDKKKIRKSLEDRGYDNDHYVIRKSGKQWQVVHKDVGGFERIDDGKCDIQMEAITSWLDDVDLVEVGYYIPDVVTSKRYHDLAHVLLDVLKGVIDGDLPFSGQGVQLWLLGACRSRLDWAVTKPDMKLAMFVLRQAYGYWREDNPPPHDALYGQNGFIRTYEDRQ